MTIPSSIISSYGFPADVSIQPFGTGLINHTWKIRNADSSFILQRLNTDIFKTPWDIAENIEKIGCYLSETATGYLFVTPTPTTEGKLLEETPDGVFRLFPFITGSVSHDVLETPAMAKEAAQQFGRFTRLLNDFDASRLKITLPSFHDLALRYRQFLTALENGDRNRIEASKDLIATLQSHAHIADMYSDIVKNKSIRLRVTHHDTKISNVLFDNSGNGLCVIDLDTVMPGYFISDLGDMMRTYLSPVSEEEEEMEKIVIREDFYQAIIEGFYTEMKEVMSEEEKNYVFYSGEFMIYMQALRFITDHLNGDIYYGAKYPGHNYNRAQNQAVLLEKYLEKKEIFNRF